MSNSTLRRIRLLLSIPRHPNKKSVSTLLSELESHGHEVDRRQVQRDLNMLSAEFAIVCDEESPPGWSWSKDHESPFTRFGMDIHSALAFCMVSQNLKSLLPTATLRHLKPFFEDAQKTLARASGRPISEWTRRTLVSQRGVVPMPPVVRAEVEAKVTQALVDGYKIAMNYCKRDRSVKSYVLSPQGLVTRGNVLYLIARKDGEGESDQAYAMHRIREIAVLEGEKALLARGLTLKELERKGAFGVSLKDTSELTLVLRFSKEAGISFHDLKYCTDQTITEETPTHITVQMTHPNNLELRWWILAYGSQVEVLSPQKLRKEIAETLGAALRRYAG